MKRFLFTLLIFLLAVTVFGIVIFLLINNKSKGALQITSDPNSKVYLNGKLIGTTPLCLCEDKSVIPEGTYTVKLVSVSGDYEAFEQRIVISPKILTVVDRNFSQKGLDSASIITLSQLNNKNKAQIGITTFPRETQVFLDNNLRGQSPMLLDNIKEADYELRFAKQGYKDKIVRVRTVLGFRLDVLIYLGLNDSIATQSSGLKISSMSAVLTGEKVTILDTPTGFLRVRKDPSLSSSEISQVLPRQEYALVEEITGWFKIKLTDGNDGWISSQYAKKN